MMISRHGQRYSCILPDTSVEMELKITNDDDDVLAIADLLQELKQKCLITVSTNNLTINTRSNNSTWNIDLELFDKIAGWF